MGFTFAKSSEERLKTVHPDIRKVVYTVKTIADIDFDVSCGHRSVEEQQNLYKIGRTVNPERGIITNCDGIKNRSKHNDYPSNAVDLYIYAGNKNHYDKIHLAYIAGIFRAVWVMLKQQGAIKSEFIWGGNFNENAYLNEKADFDFPHFEIK